MIRSLVTGRSAGDFLCALSALGVLALAGQPLAAQTIVGDGADLQAVIDAAAVGDVIEIQSNAVFQGSLFWSSDKNLTLRAGAGFAPTIRGDSATVGLQVFAAPTSTGTTRLEGLRIERGSTGAFGTPSAVAFSDGQPSIKVTDIVFDGCTFFGDFTIGGNGGFGLTAEVHGATIDGRVNLIGATTMSASLLLTDSVVGDGLDAAGQSTTAYDITVLDSIFGDRSNIQATGSSTIDMELRRSVVGNFSFSGFAPGASDLLMESSVVRPGATFTSTGLEIRNDATARLVNVTATGFPIGMRFVAGVSAENLLLFDNGSDLLSADVLQISNSLIEDGLFDGQNGNFAGTPVTSCSYALVDGSLGVDAGNSAAVELGTLDINGAARVQDSDGDGAVAVNVGAHEALGTLDAAAVVEVNGSGINPTGFTAFTDPIVGETLTLSVPFQFGVTLATVVGLDAAAPAPFPNPFGSGELLVPLSPALFAQLLVGTGSHTFPVPDDPSLIGLSLRAQGLRIDDDGSGTKIAAQNALDLTFGDC